MKMSPEMKMNIRKWKNGEKIRMDKNELHVIGRGILSYHHAIVVESASSV